VGGRLQVLRFVLRLLGESSLLIAVDEVLLSVKLHGAARGTRTLYKCGGDVGPLILQQYLETSLCE